MLPLHILKACEELFRNLRERAIGVKSCNDLALAGYALGTLTDVPAHHLQFSFLVHVDPIQAHAGAGRQPLGRPWPLHGLFFSPAFRFLLPLPQSPDRVSGKRKVADRLLSVQPRY